MSMTARNCQLPICNKAKLLVSIPVRAEPSYCCRQNAYCKGLILQAEPTLMMVAQGTTGGSEETAHTLLLQM